MKPPSIAQQPLAFHEQIAHRDPGRRPIEIRAALLQRRLPETFRGGERRPSSIEHRQRFQPAVAQIDVPARVPAVSPASDAEPVTWTRPVALPCRRARQSGGRKSLIGQAVEIRGEVERAVAVEGLTAGEIDVAAAFPTGPRRA